MCFSIETNMVEDGQEKWSEEYVSANLNRAEDDNRRF